VELGFDHSLTALAIYLAAAGVWLVVWRAANGYELMRSVRLLWMPFLLALAFLLGNGVVAVLFDAVGTAEYEESRFVFLGERATIAVQALASILIVATIVYGLTIRRLPVDFIRFMVYAVVAILGLMAPILWIPDGAAAGFFVLRHFQNAALVAGLFLCVAGITIMLNDLLTHGEARVVLEPEDEAALAGDEPAGDEAAPAGGAEGGGSGDGQQGQHEGADRGAVPRASRAPFLRGPTS